MRGEQIQFNFKEFIRQNILDMKAYTPILPFEVLSQQLKRRPRDIIKLDANENPYGPSPGALEALKNLDGIMHIYPDPEARELRKMLQVYTGAPMENILVGAGADELIDLIMRLVLSPGDLVVNCPPTFGMYSFDASLAGAHIINVHRRTDFSLDIAIIKKVVKAHQPKLIFVCSPNNPDGSVLTQTELDELLTLPALIVLDEAYIEFSTQDSAIASVANHDNLIVLRTFSKWAGLAGLRVGYGVFPDWMMPHLWKIKQPYNLNVAGDQCARASLADLPLLQERITRIISERERLENELRKFAFLSPYPSESNFVLCRVVRSDAGKLKQRLAEEYGILIRYFNKPGLDDHIRISAGTPQQTGILLQALHTIGETL